jgi:hypothetical protein
MLVNINSPILHINSSDLVNRLEPRIRAVSISIGVIFTHRRQHDGLGGHSVVPMLVHAPSGPNSALRIWPLAKA